MRIIQINLGNFGSTGGIAQGINSVARSMGMEAYMAYPWDSNNKEAKEFDILIGTEFGRKASRKLARLTGYNGCFSVVSTLRFLNKVRKYNPDIIHLHNLHNSYINLPMLFHWIKKHEIPIVWTLHDCWAFTGQCPYFTMVKYGKWKKGCYDCPQYTLYPQAKVDRTKTMWKLKKKWFTGIKDMTIVTPSRWLADLVKESFLSEYPIRVINNGIDLNVFKPSENDFRKVYGLEGKKLILAVALGWDKRKGYGDLLELAKILDDTYRIVLVGVSKEQIDSLPPNILGIERTNSPKELAEIYSACDIFVNTTYEDNYPTVNIEARACGLPVITYQTGGSPESAGDDAVLIEVGDIHGLKLAIEQVVRKRNKCICNEELSAEEKFVEYTELYDFAGVLSIRKKYNCIGKIVLLGVAFGWSKRKGPDVFIELSKRLDPTIYQIILVGTDEYVDRQLPENIISIHRTQNQQELAELYSATDLFVNPTREEVLGMVNVEALACGTPGITFRTGGSPECYDETCGLVVDCDDVDAMAEKIVRICENTPYSIEACVARARAFDKSKKFEEYIRLYEEKR